MLTPKKYKNGPSGSSYIGVLFFRVANQISLFTKKTRRFSPCFCFFPASDIWKHTTTSQRRY